MTEWQPIETAPTNDPASDPIIILLWLPGAQAIAFGRVYTKHDGNKKSVAIGYHGFEASHWMPMPDPPK